MVFRRRCIGRGWTILYPEILIARDTARVTSKSKLYSISLLFEFQSCVDLLLCLKDSNLPLMDTSLRGAFNNKNIRCGRHILEAASSIFTRERVSEYIILWEIFLKSFYSIKVKGNDKKYNRFVCVFSTKKNTFTLYTVTN